MRVAVIGCGAISQTHLNAIREAGQTLCALCDTERSQAEAKGADVPIYTSYIDLLEKEHPDCVHICTPHYLHADMCVEALQRGVNVLCEKPVATTVADLERIIKAESASSATLGVCLQNRYEPNMQVLKNYTEHGVVTVCGSVFWNRDEKYYASGSWRGKWETEGGGVAINQALHTLDLLQYLGGMPKYVTAHCFNDHLQGAIEVEDTVSARFETENGRILTFFATTAGGATFPAEMRMKTERKETLVASSKFLTVNGTLLQANASEIAGKEAWGSGHSALIADFYRHLEAGLSFPIDATEGGRSLRLVLSIYASNGERIPILS